MMNQILIMEIRMKVYIAVRKDIGLEPTREYKLLGIFTKKTDAVNVILNRIETPLYEKLGYEPKSAIRDTSQVDASKLFGERLVTDSNDFPLIHEYYKVWELKLNEELRDMYVIFYGD